MKLPEPTNKSTPIPFMIGMSLGASQSADAFMDRY